MTCFAADFANPPIRPPPTWAYRRLLKIDRYQRILKRRKSSQGLEQLLRVSSWDGFSWRCRQEKDAQVLVKVAKLWQELTLRAHSANNICETACCEMYFKVPPLRFMAARHAYVSLPDGLQGVVMGQSEPFTFSLIPRSRPQRPSWSFSGLTWFANADSFKARYDLARASQKLWLIKLGKSSTVTAFQMWASINEVSIKKVLLVIILIYKNVRSVD